MLQRAASSAYSWWWASHVRTKQSKWLEQSLQDMGDKVETVLKLITQDGDSFAKRAEMYYKHRPELISFVEESFRAYQSLAERFDHISKELQNANSTLASAFPDQFQYEIDEDDDFPSPRVPRKFPVETPANPNIPNAPKKFPTKNIKALMALTKKPPSKVQPKTTSHAVPKSGLSKSEALAEIDKLQKQILTFQTEKEFAKSSYESGYEKYFNLEEEIARMQDRISKLQDEFGISQAIDDNEARTLMAEAAIKSCQDTLAQLQEKQRRGAEEAKAERQRIMDSRDRLRSLKGELASGSGDYLKLEENWSSFNDEAEILGEAKDMEMLQDTIKEPFDVGDTNNLTVSEMAEKVDELVSKVINLETAVSSQTALIHTLRSETDELQSHIKNLEDEKANLIEGKNDLSEQVSEMVNKLKGLHDLDLSLQQHNNNLKTHFSEAHSNIDSISKKLHDVKPDDEFEISSQSQPNKIITADLAMDSNEEDMKLANVTHTRIKPSLLDSKPEPLVIGLPEEPFRSKVEELADVQGTQQQSATLSPNEPLTTQNIHLEEMPNSKAEEQVNPQEAQSENTPNIIADEPVHPLGPTQTLPQTATLSTNEHINPSEVESEKTPNVIVEEPVQPEGAQQQPATPQEVQSAKTPSITANQLVNSQGTKDEPATLSTNEQMVKSEKSPSATAEEPVKPEGDQQQPATSQEVQSENTSTITADQAVIYQGTQDQPAILSTNEPRVLSEKSPSTTAEEPVNPEEPRQQKATVSINEPVTPQEVQSEETPNTKVEEQINDQGTQLQPTNLPKTEQVTPQFKKKAAPSVPKHKPTLAEILRMESMKNPLGGSGAPSSVYQQEQKIKEVEEDEPDWQQLFIIGLAGKEKVLLEEYTKTLRNYKDAKKRLGEIEKKSQLDFSNIETQLRELKNYNAMKDDEIQSLRQKLNALQRKLEEYKNTKEDNVVSPPRNIDPLPQPDYGDDIRLRIDEHEISPAEAKLRADIDEILEENLDFWMRFSASFGQIQKFQNGVRDLFSELVKFEKEKAKKEGSNHEADQTSMKSDIRPIFKHLREIKTELTVWLEQSEQLKEELQRRISQLCKIQDEIKHAVNVGAADDDMKFTSYNAAKFQGEVANMQQENNKVKDELQAGMDHISSLQIDVERTMNRLNEELGFYGSKSQNENQMRSGSKGRVPLRSFIFGVKQQKKKQSIFSLIQPAAANRRYQQLKPDKSP